MTKPQLTYYILGLLLFATIITGGTVMMGMLQADKTNVLPGEIEHLETFNKSFNKQSDVEASVGRLRGNIENASTDFGTFGVLNSLISTSWQGMKLLFSSYDFMGDALVSTNKMFGIPLWVSSLAVLAITVIIAFQIWGAVFQRDL